MVFQNPFRLCGCRFQTMYKYNNPGISTVTYSLVRGSCIQCYIYNLFTNFEELIIAIIFIL